MMVVDAPRSAEHDCICWSIFECIAVVLTVIITAQLPGCIEHKHLRNAETHFLLSLGVSELDFRCGVVVAVQI